MRAAFSISQGVGIILPMSNPLLDPATHQLHHRISGVSTAVPHFQLVVAVNNINAMFMQLEVWTCIRRGVVEPLRLNDLCRSTSPNIIVAVTLPVFLLDLRHRRQHFGVTSVISTSIPGDHLSNTR